MCDIDSVESRDTKCTLYSLVGYEPKHIPYHHETLHHRTNAIMHHCMEDPSKYPYRSATITDSCCCIVVRTRTTTSIISQWCTTSDFTHKNDLANIPIVVGVL